MCSEGYSTSSVCLSVCLSVCVFPYSGSTRDEKYNKIYQCVKRQICGNIKMVFFLKLFYSKVCFFYPPQQGGQQGRRQDFQGGVSMILQ